MLRLKQSNVTVPDKFTFTFHQDGYVSRAIDKESWFADIDKHYKDNGYPQPDNWKELAEDQLCRRLSGEWCDGGDEHSFIKTRFTFDDFVRGSAVLGSVMMSDDAIVDQQTAENRAMICSRCVANVDVPGCKSCFAMANLVGELKGKKTTRYDHLLKACGVCHCSNEAQIWVKGEHLKKGATDDMMKTYAQIPDCWKYAEVVKS